MIGDQKLKAIATSGPSGGFLPTTIRRKNLDSPKSKAWAEKNFAPGSDTYDIVDLPLVYLAWGAAVVAGRFAGGALGDRFNRATVTVAALLCGALGSAIAAALPNEGPMIASCIVGGFGLGVANTNLSAALSQQTPPYAQGRIMSWSGLAYNGLVAVAATIGGFSFEVTPIGPFLSSIAVLLAAVAICAPYAGSADALWDRSRSNRHREKYCGSHGSQPRAPHRPSACPRSTRSIRVETRRALRRRSARRAHRAG